MEKQCDYCGEFFTGENYTVYDENYNKENVNRCKTCYELEISGIIEYE